MTKHLPKLIMSQDLSFWAHSGAEIDNNIYYSTYVQKIDEWMIYFHIEGCEANWSKQFFLSYLFTYIFGVTNFFSIEWCIQLTITKKSLGSISISTVDINNMYTLMCIDKTKLKVQYPLGTEYWVKTANSFRNYLINIMDFIDCINFLEVITAEQLSHPDFIVFR